MRREALAAAATSLRAQLDAEAAEAPSERSQTPPVVIPEREPEWWRGDAHALLRWVYCNPGLPLDLRVDAAKSAVRFERPALVASHVQHSNAPSREVLARMSTDQLKALLLEMDEGEAVIDAEPEADPED